MESNGDFVVVWDSDHELQNVSMVRAQRFDAAAHRLGVEFGVADAGNGSAVEMDADGDVSGGGCAPPPHALR
jgi:hypothetical protein